MSLQMLSPDCTVAEIAAAMERDGACVVRDVLSAEVLTAIDAEFTPLIEQTVPHDDDWSGRNTKRTGGVLARSSKARGLAVHPLILEAANKLLGPYCESIQLNLSQIITILPGQGAQPLHRDRFVYGGGDGSFVGPGGIPKSIEPMFNTIWAVSDFTEENGATHVVPGSHHWDFDREAAREESLQAEMTRGSVLLYNGTVSHGGGANRSSSARIGLNITYCLSWLRQEENQYLSCPPEVAKNFDQALTDLLGYTMGNYALGFYTDPFANGSPAPKAPEVAVGRQPHFGLN